MLYIDWYSEIRQYFIFLPGLISGFLCHMQNYNFCELLVVNNSHSYSTFKSLAALYSGNGI